MEGTAITIKIMMGITVHTTSKIELWVVFDGTGFAFALNFTQI